MSRRRRNHVRHRHPVTHADALEMLEYEPETGAIRWKAGANHRKPGGTLAGSVMKDGYVLVGLRGNRFAAARLVWFIVHGEWPCSEIDHINGDPSDNRLCNLRLATRAQNNRNRALARNNTSGFKGVSFQKCTGKWVAFIRDGRRRHHLGLFETKEAAVLARHSAEVRLFGEFRRDCVPS